MISTLKHSAATIALLAALTACSAERPDPESPPRGPATSSGPVSGAAEFPDPAPGGPTRAAEPYVAGPDNIDAIETTVRPDGGAADGIDVTFDRTSRTTTGEKPSAARRFVFLFDQTIRFDPEAFPTCERAVIEGRGIEACPEGSRVGTGRSVSYPNTSADVAIFNTRYPDGTRGVLITIPAARVILENTLEPVADSYRGNYAFALDGIVPPTPVPPAQRGATTRFQVSFGAARQDAGQMRSFVRSSAAPGAELRFGQWSEFVTGQVIRPEARTPRS